MRQIIEDTLLTITDPAMTRFMMTLGDAVDLVIHAFKYGKNGDIFVQKAPAATLEVLARGILEVLDKPGYSINTIGTRHGEKLFESLCSREEMFLAEDMGDYYRIPLDLRYLSYGKFIEEGIKHISELVDYNSHNTLRLDLDGMKSLLMKLNFIRDSAVGKSTTLEY